MRLSIVDTIAPNVLPATLPIRLQQMPSTASNVIKLAFLLPATVALLFPFLMLAEACAADPAMRAAIASKPQALVQIGLGLAFWTVLFALPLKRLADGLVSRRAVVIADGAVHISERNLLGSTVSSTALNEYSGVVHHVRASLSGLRHELILAHPEHNRSVLLAISDRFSQGDIDRACQLLGLSEAPSVTIYRAVRRLGTNATPHITRTNIAQAA